MTTELALAKRYAVEVIQRGDVPAKPAEARAVRLAVDGRGAVVKVVYDASRTPAWVDGGRLLPFETAARFEDIANGGVQCERCGCTSGVACPRGCGWASLRPPICTECAA